MSAAVIHSNNQQVLTLLDNHSSVAEDRSITNEIDTHKEITTTASSDDNTNPSKKIPKLGPFLLLKTLGIGEFGKVKLGRHAETGQIVKKNHQYNHYPILTMMF